MDTNINFTNDLNGESDCRISFNLPRKIYNLTAGRAVADGAIVVESESCTYETMLNIDRARLLNEASLLLLPNTYKESKLYSHKPLNGNGDFTATRATTATRVNAAGLVDLVPYNLVSWSEMFSDASWTKSNVTISPNSISAPNGFLTADTLTGNGVSGSHGILNGFTPVISTTYTLSCYVKADTNNFIQITAAASAFGSSFFANFDIANGVVGNYGAPVLNPTIENAGDGWYRVSVSAVALTGVNVGAIGIYLISSNTSVRLETNTLTTSVFAWGAQLVEGTSARDYLRTETRLNIPRLDYSLGGCPNILLEPQRTNLALQSSSFDSATWVKNASSVTANSTTSPSGIVDADTFAGDGNLSPHRIEQPLNVVNATTYSWSVYAKKNTNNFIQLTGFDSGFGTSVFANFDLNSGVVGSVGVGTTATITNVGDGWYRCAVNMTSITTGSSGVQVILVTSATALRKETNTLSTSVFLWGAQLEAGAYSTSFIPTTTASVTRNADSITRNNIFTNGLITASGGTWFVELRNNVSLTRDAAGSNGMYLSGGNGFNNDGFLIWNWNITTPLQITKYVSNSFTVLHTLPVGTCKVAIKWNGSTADIFVNGVKVIASTVFTGTAMQNLFGTGASIPFNIQQMALYPTPLTDTELISMTTL